MPDSTQAAHHESSVTTQLALERTSLAQERTLMAWIRTSLSMISFGFTIFKFFQYLQDTGAAAHWRPQAPRNIGCFLVILGTSMLILAIIQHWAFLRRVKADWPGKKQISLTLIAALLISLLGVFMILNLLFKIGSF